jgi:sodium transport system permease protein
MVPAVMSMTMTSDIAPSLALVPILNAALIIKQALAGSFDSAFIALAFLASLVYAAVALAFATRLFGNEGVLIKA